MDDALLQAYTLLCSRNPGVPIGVIGESIGSGPACTLARAKPAPAKIVLLVPFDTLVSVASERMPFLPVGLLLRDAWDNGAALEHYDGPIDIFGAIDDSVIPFEHAKRLAAALPHSHFKAILGGHNDWSTSSELTIAR
jgi:pimeloyl-ACP methyl ester carboxylesterase